MAIYEAIITKPCNMVGTIRQVRHYTSHSIAHIQAAIAAAQPVITISSDEHGPEIDPVSGHGLQQQKFVQAVEELLALGNIVELRYRASATDRHEAVSYAAMKNVMERELISLSNLVAEANPRPALDVARPFCLQFGPHWRSQ